MADYQLAYATQLYIMCAVLVKYRCIRGMSQILMSF